MDHDVAIHGLVESLITIVALMGGLVAGLAALVLCAVRLLPPVQQGTIGFFHPFADGGGGGERVLWCAVQAVHEAAPQAQIVLYVRQGVNLTALITDAQQRFNVDLTDVAPRLQLVPLRKTHLLDPDRYPRLTLVRQALGAVRVGHEALSQLVPQVYVDTTGWAFTYPLARLAGSSVAAYVHYPTISANMIGRVAGREATYNNNAAVARSRLLSRVKTLYYQALAAVYGACGGLATVVMANSSWTRRHVGAMFWGRSTTAPRLVYPPCDTTDLQQLPLDRRLKQLYVVSVAQFRPEKDHRLQLEAWSAVKARAGEPSIPNSHVLYGARLKLVGGCRDDRDRERLAGLQAYAQQLGIAGSVDWVVNAPFSQLKSLLGEAVAGLHTMRDEHFGISVVEYMAAGAIPIAHNSAGPAEDIVVEVLDPSPGANGERLLPGFLATTVHEFADAITKVLVMDQRQRLHIAAAAQRHAAGFSQERFKEGFLDAMAPMLVSLLQGGGSRPASGGDGTVDGAVHCKKAAEQQDGAAAKRGAREGTTAVDS